MKRKYIKYERLSEEIKHEIREYHKNEKKAAEDSPLEDSMFQWFDEKFDEWLITRTSETGSSTRRKHFRLEIEIPIKIIDTLIESSEDDGSAIDLVGQVINISRGGLYFKYNKPIEISSIIKVIIDLSKLDKELHDVEALAMVIRVDKLDNDEYGIGIMFSSIYDVNKDSIDVFILKNLSNYIYSE